MLDARQTVRKQYVIMNKYYIGIDIGKNGAIVVIGPTGVVSTSIMPMIGKGKGSEIDKKALRDFFWSYADEKTVVVIEDVHSIFGVSAGSNFQFGRALGIIEGLVEVLQLPYYKVSPKTWQGTCFEGVPVIEKPGTKAKGRNSYDTKAMALIAAQRLYPKLDLRKSQKAEKPHDGIVDALLMAHYAKLKY